ncbi:hypothetical protein [Paludibaculum fermentans]|uniref:hypothetical protein n=1 Tax=Paludibaculum fermentans TaxID=1473598 RepID=UPI003EBC4FE2
MLACGAILPFLPFLGLPLISDDYSQWFFARRYISQEGLPRLAEDVLYRSRATSLVLTRVLDEAFGLAQRPHLAAGLALHALNVLLLFQVVTALRARPATALAAASFFAVHSGHQEAIVWIASQHELLVFAFGAMTVLSWLRWLERRGGRAGAAMAGYAMTLYSKESGVVFLPLLFLLWLVSAGRDTRRLWPLAVMAGFTAYYAWAIFQSAGVHQHLNDGTFSFQAPFWITLPESLWRLLWPAGLVALPLIWLGRDAGARRLAAAALGWMIVALGPYVFLTYQTRVPSRHTYLAAAGLAVLLGLAVQSLAGLAIPRPRLAAAAASVLFITGNVLNLWTRKLPQFERRAEATERFLRATRNQGEAIEIGRAPFPLWVYQHAAAIALGRAPETVYAAGLGPAHSFSYSDSDHP